MHIFQSTTKMTVYVSRQFNINTIQLIYTSEGVASWAHAVCVLLIAISALSRSNSFSACSPTMAWLDPIGSKLKISEAFSKHLMASEEYGFCTTPPDILFLFIIHTRTDPNSYAANPIKWKKKTNLLHLLWCYYSLYP